MKKNKNKNNLHATSKAKSASRASAKTKRATSKKGATENIYKLLTNNIHVMVGENEQYRKPMLVAHGYACG